MVKINSDINLSLKGDYNEKSLDYINYPFMHQLVSKMIIELFK